MKNWKKNMKLKKYKYNSFSLSIDTLPGTVYNKRKKIWEPSWYDRDEVLLHANFQILRDFMEKEDVKNIDWNWCRESKRAWREINRLYTWYTQERPQRVDIWHVFYKKFKDEDWNTLPSPLKGCVAIRQGEMEKEWYKEDTQNLIALMKIREYLWT